MTIFQHPRTREPLTSRGDRLVGTSSREAFPIRQGPVPIYDLFYLEEEGEAAPNSRSAHPWSREAFDAHYDALGGYEDGEEYEIRQGGHPELTAFHHRRVKGRLVEWVTPGPNHTILDVGCGSGWFLMELRERYVAAGHTPTAVGVEASESQLVNLARRAHREKLEQVVPVIGNAEHLPFADASFDLVTCSEVLEQVNNPLRALAEMGRVLKPGGHLLVSAPSRLNEVLWDLVLVPATRLGKRILRRREGEAGEFKEFYAPLYPGELTAMVEAAGLKLDHFEANGLIPHPHYFTYLPQSAIPAVVRAFEWFDRRFAQRLEPLAAHLLLSARRPAARRPAHRPVELRPDGRPDPRSEAERTAGQRLKPVAGTR